MLQKYFNGKYCLKSIDTTHFWGLNTVGMTQDSMQHRIIESMNQ